MMVPPAKGQLHKPHSAFDQATSQQATARKLSRSIRLANSHRLAARVECVSGGGLHPERRFHCTNPGLKLGIVPICLGVNPIERLESVELSFLIVGTDGRVSQMADHL